MILRILTALIALPVIYILIFLKNPYFFIGLVILALIVTLNETYLMISKKNLKPYFITGNIFAVMLYLMVLFNAGENYFPGFIALFFMVVFTMTIISGKTDNFYKIPATIMPVLYTGFLGLFIIKLRLLENGSYYIFIFLLITFIYDAGAYFTGSFMGKHKLIPSISPGKTIEGCIGGLLSAVISVIIIHFFYLPKGLFGQDQLLHLIILSVLLSIAGQAGDISESLLKRFSGVKNSSEIIPGHGGFFDRIDSALFNAPAMFFYLFFFVL
ncbi:MAG: phosphatidate cytidylyltransferase [Candidatus Goldbacteria bacterium]|nr:phosphatidate cytidylyltransferase [Candidatus Goldiibacteriota bacterium]HPD18705.1 phosphatidate cytidylyltransferase [Candidatus Goldiibacteriota bacterium]